MNIDQQLLSITDDALQRGIRFFALFAVPTTAVSVWRGVNGEWQSLFAVQLVLLIALLAITAFSRRIPSVYLGGVIIGLSTTAAVGGLYTYGSIAPAGHWFMAISVFYLGMLSERRGMVLGAMALLGMIALLAYLHLHGYATPTVSPAQFALSPVNWLIEIMCAAVFIAIVLPTLRKFVEASGQWMEEHELRRRELGRLAMEDTLTGLPRLRTATDRLAVACNRQQQSGKLVGVMFIDLDGFKEVNDEYGHEAGDITLQIVAARLTDHLRDGDTVARVGGDEFVVVLEELVDENAAARVAAQLIALIGRAIHYEGKLLPIGASIGIAICPDHGDDPAVLVRMADQAMYQSKRSGRNGFAFARHHESNGCTVMHSIDGACTA